MLAVLINFTAPGWSLAVEPPEQIAIAAVAPLAGRFAARGRALALGMRLAVEDINGAGGLRLANGNTTLKLTVYNDNCDAVTARKIAWQLALDEIAFVAGHVCTRASIATAKIYAASGIIQIAPLNRHTHLTGKRARPGLFRLAGRDDRQGYVAGKFMARTYPKSRIAVIHDRTLAAMALAKGVMKGLKENNHKNIYQTTLRPGEKDYSRLVGKLGKRKARVVHISSYATETAILTRQIHETDRTIQIITPDSTLAPEFLSIAGEAGNKIYVTVRPDSGDYPAALRIISRLGKAGAGRMMDTLSAYAAVQIWKQSVEAASSMQLAKVAAIIRSRTFDTVLGNIAFNRSGDSNLPSYRVYRWARTKPTTIKLVPVQITPGQTPRQPGSLLPAPPHLAQ